MITRLTTFCLLLLVLPSLGFGQMSSEAQQQFVQAREQGVLYWKKRRYLAAERALAKAVAMPNGKEDFKALYYLVLVNERLLRPDAALRYSERAMSITSASPSKRAKMRSIYEELSANYGKVELRTAMNSSVTRGTFELRPITPFLNKTKKRYVMQLQERYATNPIKLPHSLFLPYGSYNIAGLHIDLNAQTSGSELGIFLDPPPQPLEVATNDVGSASKKERLWWIVGGVTATLAVGATTFFLLSESDPQPGGEFRVSVRNSR